MPPLPKPNAVRRNKQDESHLVDHDVADSHKKLFKYASYSRATQKWWETWVESEQAMYFAPTDWQRLQMLAVIVEQYYGTGRQNKAVLLAEIRQNESLLGATIMDRMRMMRNSTQQKINTISGDDSGYQEDDELFKNLGG